MVWFHPKATLSLERDEKAVVAFKVPLGKLLREERPHFHRVRERLQRSLPPRALRQGQVARALAAVGIAKGRSK